ncbi:MAG: Rieske 2Fe-2S domain-containing protein [Patulibacter sp.]|nr:Rieske 2Fe-2S domain-containing protein [Patulibacter sp.]
MTTKSATATRHVVAPLEEFPDGETRIVEVKGRSIGVIHDNGTFFALRNVCPHHGAPLCAGRVQGFMRPSEPHVYDYSGDDADDRVVLCPWHGYKFRLKDGRSVTEPETSRVRTYEVAVEDGEVVLYV